MSRFFMVHCVDKFSKR